MVAPVAAVCDRRILSGEHVRLGRGFRRLAETILALFRKVHAGEPPASTGEPPVLPNPRYPRNPRFKFLSTKKCRIANCDRHPAFVVSSKD
jgi:hypothetical protein